MASATPLPPASDTDDGESGRSDAGRVQALDAQNLDDADLMPGIRRGLSQRFSYGGFDATVTSVQVFEPDRPSRVARPSATMPPTGTTVPAPPVAASVRSTSSISSRSAESPEVRVPELPVVRVELTTWNTTPAEGQLEPFRLRAGRSLYPAAEVTYPSGHGSNTERLGRGDTEDDGGTRVTVEFRVPAAAASLLDSAMLVVGAAGTRQAVVPLGPRASERSVRNPRATDTTMRSAAFGPGQQYSVGVFEVDKVEVGASVGHLGAPDVGLVWVGISYGTCVQGTATELRPVLRSELGASVEPTGYAVRSGTARGPLPVAPACPGWATAVAHWQVPPSAAGTTVVLDLVDGTATDRVVGAMRFEVPTLPDESTPPTMPRCSPSR